MKAEFLALSLFLAPVSTTFAASSAPHVRQDGTDFRAEYMKAMRIGDKALMGRLVKDNTDAAVAWIIDTAEAISNAPSEAIYERMAALKAGWAESMKTDFCDQMERYFSFLDAPTKRERIKLRREYDKLQAQYFANLEEKDESAFIRIAVEFEGAASAFETIGDWYYYSQCYGFAAISFDESMAGKKADLDRATNAYKCFLDSREKIGLKDKIFITNKPRYEQLVALGFGSEAKAQAAEVEAAEAAAAGPLPPAVTMPMAFELVEDLGAIERPSYYMDEIYQIWNLLPLQRKGSQYTIPRLENGPTVYRVGSAEVKLDADGDGAGEVEVPMRGNVDPVVFEIGDGPSRRPWAFLATTGLERDEYQGFETNLSPTDDVVNIYIAPAGSLTGDLNGVPIRIFDDNLDGIYGSPATSWGHVGMSKDHYMPEMDSMVIGDSKRAQPFSEYVQVGDKWYKLEVLNGGTSVKAQEVRVKTGTLSLKYKGTKPQYVIVKGSNDYENSYFDLVGEKEVEVPVGRYELFFGIVTKGKKRQVMKAVILPGADTPTWDVLKPDTEVEIELGSPYGFAFDYSVGDEEIVLNGQSVVVTGVGGERYERIWGARTQPEVSYRKAGSGRGSKGEDTKLILNQNDISEYGGWPAAWFPLDLVIPKKSSETDVEVKLMEKKNKLFGKIESDWK